MSRTDDLRGSGATERGGSGGAPFVEWPDEYSYVEGKVIGFWEGQYGPVATLRVDDCSDALQMKGKEDGREFKTAVEPGVEANVGLNKATLEGTIIESDVGATFHIAFEGWSESQQGQRYREFAVLELDTEGGLDGYRDDADEHTEPQGTDVGPGHPDADIPF